MLQLAMMHGLMRTAAVLLASTLVASAHPLASSIGNGKLLILAIRIPYMMLL